jgi:periplasmic protein CpxP/Spy
MAQPFSSLPRFAPLAVALSLVSGVALAQPFGGTAGEARGGPSGAELARLHAALKIGAAQEGAWRGFVDASQPDPQQQARERSAEDMLPTLTAPQRVDLSIAVMQADLDTLRRRGAALKTFYATLTPAQKAIFDRETRPGEDDGEGR